MNLTSTLTGNGLDVDETTGGTPPLAATTSFNVNVSTNYTLSAFREFIRVMRSALGAWGKPYLHNTIFPRNTLDTTNYTAVASNATPTINAFNWWLTSGQLAEPIDRGDGVVQKLLDGFVDGAVALDAGGGTGVFKIPSTAQSFLTGGGAGISTTVNSPIVNSSGGVFTPAMTGKWAFIPGAGASGATMFGVIQYLSPNQIFVCTPNSFGPNGMTNCADPNRTSATGYTRAGTALTDANLYISRQGEWSFDGLHLTKNGEDEISALGNFRQLTALFR